MATLEKIEIKEKFKSFFRPIVNRIPNNIRYGKKYRFFLKEVDSFYKLSIEKKREIQLVKLRELLKYSYENVPYYKELFDLNNISYNIKSFDEFEKIPFLTKDILRNNIEKFISKVDIKKIKLTTGGTTGMPLEFYLDNTVNMQENCFVDYYWKKYSKDYKNTSKIVILRGNIPKNGKIFEKIGNKLIMSSFKLNQMTIDKYLKKIIDFQPEYLHIYPSSLNILAEYILKEDVELNLKNLKGIFSSSETLSDYQKQNIEKAFKCIICDLYGNSERNVIAFNNIEEDKNYKLDLLYGYTEILSEENKNIMLVNKSKGEIVATSFWNKSMPLIRYKTGDIAITNGSYEKVNKILGRKSEYFIDKYKNKILFTWADEIFWNNKEKIEAYQYIQYEEGKVILKIKKKIDSELFPEELDDLKNEFNRLYENISIKIEIVDEILRTSRGKYRFLIQNIK